MKTLNNEQQTALNHINDNMTDVICTGKCYRLRNKNGEWAHTSIRKPVITQLKNMGHVTISNGVVSAVSHEIKITNVGEATKPALNPTIANEMRALGIKSSLYAI